MNDLIDREKAIEDLQNRDPSKLYDIEDIEYWINSLPSAEKAQLSEEDATPVCKCPCVYREPCDYCHYDAYRGHGCPAEEGMKDG